MNQDAQRAPTTRIVFELQMIICFFAACAIALTWHIPGWKGWAIIAAQAIGGVSGAIAIRSMYEPKNIRSNRRHNLQGKGPPVPEPAPRGPLH